MQELFTKKAKKIIVIAALTCFLSTPISYTMSISSATAAALDNQTQFEQRHNPPRGDRKDNVKRPAPPRNNKGDKDRPAPPRNNKGDKDRPAPPRNNRGNEHWNKDKKNPPPPPPPRHGRDDRWDRDDDKDFDKGDITTAVLVGGVIGAIIAKNT